MNTLSHRAEVRPARDRILAEAAGRGQTLNAGALWSRHSDARHEIALRRREEQRQARIAAGTDRATIRASRERPR